MTPFGIRKKIKAELKESKEQKISDASETLSGTPRKVNLMAYLARELPDGTIHNGTKNYGCQSHPVGSNCYYAPYTLCRYNHDP